MYHKISEPLVILGSAMKESFKQTGLFKTMPKETQDFIISLGITESDYNLMKDFLGNLSPEQLKALQKGTLHNASVVTAGKLSPILKKIKGKKNLVKFLATVLVAAGSALAQDSDALSDLLLKPEKIELTMKKPAVNLVERAILNMEEEILDNVDPSVAPKAPAKAPSKLPPKAPGFSA